MNTSLKIKIALVIIGIFLASIFFQGSLGGQVIFSKTIEFENVPLPSPRSWKLVDKLEEKEDELEKLQLTISTNSFDFYEYRTIQSGNKITTNKKKLSEHNKDIGFKIVNKDSGEVRIIMVSVVVGKDGIKLISPPGYQIEIEARSNGIKWNKWNTAYKIISPEGWFVLENRYPIINDKIQKVTIQDKKGKKRTANKKVYSIEYFTYSPYSPDLHFSELVDEGKEYLKRVVREALVDLKERRVYSRTDPKVLVADLESMSANFFGRLPILEHTDMTEFSEDPQRSTERVLVLIGANKEVAFSKTGSSAGALGWVQYTSKTYKAIRKAYPSARLIEDFEVGASDHLNSMKAAILLYDYNLKPLIEKKGFNVLNDPRLEEYLAASYNGSPKWVFQSLKSSIFGSFDWPTKLKNETKGYLYKIRYLQDKDLP